MTFEHRITRLPIPYDPDQGNDARAAMAGLSGPVAELIQGAGGCSPYLKSLIEREHVWLSGALDDPEAAVEGVQEAMAQSSHEQMAHALRKAKGRMALLIGLADLGGVWPLEMVTKTLTDFADNAVVCALETALLPELRRGKIPGMNEGDLDTFAGVVVLAMGKMGARELNYSSDIDLICLFDETRFDPDDFYAARQAFVRVTRRMVALLNDRTPDGYVFRTDLRLRPDPSVTPACMAMAAAETYYESLGRTWERAAYIKARPCAGDIEAGKRFLAALKPFVWRKHLDFAAIEDAHNMRLRIREHKGLGGRTDLRGHNMKLGRGGIREIEFFTQTRQLISGGRDPDLRVRGTVEGLTELVRKGWVPQDTATLLQDHYRFHRELEHRLQMLRDTQTQTLPTTPEEMDRLAAFCGRTRRELERDVLSRLTKVHELIEGFFAPDEPESEQQQTTQSRDSDLIAGLDQVVIARWHSYPALRSARASQIFSRLCPDILERLSLAAHPAEALNAFDGFLSGLPAGVQVFSMFEANPQLIDLLIDIAGTAPVLAAYLSRHASVFDAVLGGDFFADWPGETALQLELKNRMDAEDDYERKLDAARRWRKEWHFRVGVHFLRGLTQSERASAQYGDLARATLRAVWQVVQVQFAQKHGSPPGRGAAVLGMGSVGAGQLTATSDLDLIVIYDAQQAEGSDGRRPLATRPYFARLTQALITALTAPMAEGRLYEVDMRLRPSGNQGPVATSWAAFRSYQSEKAWIWEHLALTRAQAVAGPNDLCDDIEAFRVNLLGQTQEPRDLKAELSDMRARIASAKPIHSTWETKLGPGRAQDIELIAQAGALLTGSAERSVEAGLQAAHRAGWFSASEMTTLNATYSLCWRILQVARLLGTKTLDPAQLGEGGCRFLLRELDETSVIGLQDQLDRATKASADIINAALMQ